MDSESIVIEVIRALTDLDVPFMVVGALSVNLYGTPRNTQDADLVVELGGVGPSLIAARLGAAFELDPQMSFETVTATGKHLLVHRASSFHIELFDLSDDPHDQSRFARRIRADLAGTAVFVPTVEDVLVTKLRWSRHASRRKDVQDIENILTVQNTESLDWNYLRYWCTQHGTWDLLQKLLARTPRID